MANRTVKDAQSIKGTNPQYLIEKIIRSRIYECKFWKEECFALSAELLVDKAMQLKFIGGVHGGNVKPSPFLCLVLKMLQIQPEKDIILEFIRQQDFKYIRALGALYMRLTGTSLDCYKFLEPLLLDYRKMRRQKRDGGFELIHVDEYIDELLTQERVCDCIMPRIQKRHVLEENNQLEPRTSGLDDDLEEMDEEDMDDEEEETETKHEREDRRSGYRDWDRVQRSPSPRYRRSRSPPPRRRSRERDRGDYHREREGRDRDRDRHRDREGDRDRHRRDRSRDRDRHRRRSRSRERASHKQSSHRHEEDRHHKHKNSSSSGSKNRGSSKKDKEDTEIEEANKLRASLGLKPLKP